MKIIKSKFALIILLCNLFACDYSKRNALSIPTADSLQSIQEKPITHPPKSPPSGALENSLISAGLVNVRALDSTILVDLKYSSTDNFTGVDVYGDLENCYLQKEVAHKLVQAQKYLKQLHPDYRLLVFDGARPLSVQQILWDTLSKPDSIKHLYVADPKKGSIHNYGSAVDLTICDQNGQPLDMGTPYDYFGVLAYPAKEEELWASGALNEVQLDNRKLLRMVMIHAGFTPITTEWWHFNAYSRDKASEIFDIIP